MSSLLYMISKKRFPYGLNTEGLLLVVLLSNIKNKDRRYVSYQLSCLLCFVIPQTEILLHS